MFWSLSLSSFYFPYIIVPIFFIWKIWNKPKYWEDRSWSNFMLDIALSVGLILAFFMPLNGNSSTQKENLNTLYAFWSMANSNGNTFNNLYLVPLWFAIANLFVRQKVFSLITGCISFIWLADKFLRELLFNLGDLGGSIGLGLIFMYGCGILLTVISFFSIISSPKKHLPFWMFIITLFVGMPITGIILLPLINIFSGDFDEGKAILLFIANVIATIVIVYLEYRFIFLPILRRDERNALKENQRQLISYPNAIVVQQTEEQHNDVRPIRQGIKEFSEPAKETLLQKSSHIDAQLRQNFPYKSLALFGGISITIIAILIGAYYIWYKPYAIDRDAPRYYTFTNLNLRSSENSDSKDNIIEMLPYGTELITYSKDYSWARVKTGKQEGYVSSDLILPKEDFNLLDGVWGNEDAKKCVGVARYRLAVLDYLKCKEYESGATGWQIFAKPLGGPLNTVLYPRLVPENEYEALLFILKNNRTQDRKMVLYRFEDRTETPNFLAEIALSKDVSIKQVSCRRSGYNTVWIMATFNDGSYKIFDVTW